MDMSSSDEETKDGVQQIQKKKTIVDPRFDPSAPHN
jgi:hypothetical protein